MVRQEGERIDNQSLERLGQPDWLDNREPVQFIQHPDDAVDIDGLFSRDASQEAVAGHEDYGLDLFGHSQREAIVPGQRRITTELPFGLNEPCRIEVLCSQPTVDHLAFLVAGQPDEFVVQCITL